MIWKLPGPGGVDETILQKLTGFPGSAAATPILEGYVTLAEKPGEYLRLIGVDPFSAGPFFAGVEGGAATAWQGATEAWLARRGAIAVNAAWADRLQ
ncbi:hypothetical protein WB334_26130, partial [Escherichia coli]|uniref:hypothetical protein n=1 Tax=Escherichia coli TaxID=562 RepID=UPI00215828F1